MFKFKEKMKLISINQNYVKTLHDACTEVFYLPNNYSNKPYLGILLVDKNKKYAIPLTSAKTKHKYIPYYKKDILVIYEYISKLRLKNIYVHDKINNKYKHILAALVISKMIPINDDLYSVIDINYDFSDDLAIKKYKDLLKKELRFCIKFKNKILKEANELYWEQIKTGIIKYKYCNFKILEETLKKYTTK